MCFYFRISTFSCWLPSCLLLVIVYIRLPTLPGKQMCKFRNKKIMNYVRIICYVKITCLHKSTGPTGLEWQKKGIEKILTCNECDLRNLLSSRLPLGSLISTRIELGSEFSGSSGILSFLSMRSWAMDLKKTSTHYKGESQWRLILNKGHQIFRPNYMTIKIVYSKVIWKRIN